MRIELKKSIKILGASANNLLYMCPGKEYIFFTQKNSKSIIGLNRKIKGQIEIETEHELEALYFDLQEEVFWGTSIKEELQVYKINLSGKTLLHLNILESIPKEYIYEEKTPIINAITTTNNNEILISLKGTNHIYVIDKQGYFKKAILNLDIEPINDIKVINDKLFVNCGDKFYLYNNIFELVDQVNINYRNINSFIISKVSLENYKVLFLLSFRGAKHLCWAELFLDKDLDIKPPSIQQPDEKNNIYTIIELIAKEELALANIINAEGEKIKNIMNYNNIDEIISVNKSVNTVLDKMIKIEIALTNKLKEAENIADKLIKLNM